MRFHNEYGAYELGVDSDADKIDELVTKTVRDIFNEYKPTCIEEIFELDVLINSAVSGVIARRRLEFSVKMYKQKQKELNNGSSET